MRNLFSISSAMFAAAVFSGMLQAAEKSTHPSGGGKMILHVSQQKELPENHYPTIQAAYDHLAQIYRKGLLEPGSEILVHQGDYILTRPLSFSGDFPVTIRNFEQDKVNILGGKPLTGWKKTKVNGKAAFKLTLTEQVTEVPFLYVDGKMATPARWPKKGYFRTTDDCPGFVTTDENCDHFHVRKGDFDPAWHDPQNIAVHMIHRWIEEPLKIQSFDARTNRITLSTYIRYVPDKSDTEYAFLNVREALSEPGEYYFDRTSHELLLLPENEKFTAVIPSCDTLVRFLPGARWITLSGLNFQYGGSHWPQFGDHLNLRDPGFAPVRSYIWNSKAAEPCRKKTVMPAYSAPQGACNVPGVILFQRANDCTIRNCTVQSCPWYAVQILDGCSRLTFSGNELSELGGGGFIICGGNPDTVKQDPSSLTSRIVIRNNHIHDCGQFFHSAIGVLITHACGCLVDGNHIHDLYYSGISCGWTWGYGDAVARENCICRNHIHDLGKGILSDMGGIYLLGVQPGTRVFLNVIHDIVNRYYGGWGLYTDEGSSHIILERNIVYDCACEGFHQHYGRENIVRFNVFAFNKKHGIALSRDRLLHWDWPGEPHSRIVNFHNNVILTDGTPDYAIGDPALLDDGKIFADSNIIYDISGKAVSAAICNKTRISRQKWQNLGNDRHSVFQDPGFRNAAKRDFRLKKDSILPDYGFDFLHEMLK